MSTEVLKSVFNHSLNYSQYIQMLKKGIKDEELWLKVRDGFCEVPLIHQRNGHNKCKTSQRLQLQGTSL
jgi:hypothetical protein